MLPCYENAPHRMAILESESDDKTVQGPLFRLKIEKVIFLRDQMIIIFLAVDSELIARI